MRWGATILWVVAAAAAFAGALALSGPRDSRRPSSGPALGVPLVAPERLDTDTLEAIAITRRGAPPVRLERDGEGWREVEPSGLAVDPFAVSDLVQAVGSLSATRELSSEEAARDGLRQSLALDDPEATISLVGSAGTVTLRLGRLGLAGRAFIEVLEDGDSTGRVMVAGQELHNLLLRGDPGQWRVRSLFPDAGVETSAISFATADAELRLSRRGRTWTMEAPVRTRVDPQAMAAYLAALARSECDGFVGDAADEDALIAHGLLPPAGTLRVARGEGDGREERALLIGRTMRVAGGERFGLLEGHPVLLALSPKTLQSLFASPVALIDPRACDVLPSNVKRVRLTGPDGAFTIERDLDRWRCPEADGALLDPLRVDDFFSRLTEARAASILMRPIPPELLEGRIELFGFSGDPLASIDVGADPAASQVALDAGDGVARVFPASAAPPLTRAALGVPPVAPK